MATINKVPALEASDGTIWKTPDEWAFHELWLVLCKCSINADKETAKEILVHSEEFTKIFDEHGSYITYYDRTVPSVKRAPATSLIPLKKDNDDGSGNPEDGGSGLQDPASEF